MAAIMIGGMIGSALPFVAATDAGGPVQVSSAAFTLCSRGRGYNCVIDGDTIRYEGTRIRLEDIDTPETHKSRCSSEYQLGRRATLRLLELVNEGPFEIVAWGGRDTDRYGRSLRRLVRNGRSLGDQLVAEGLARNWDGARHPWC